MNISVVASATGLLLFVCSRPGVVPWALVNSVAVFAGQFNGNNYRTIEIVCDFDYAALHFSPHLRQQTATNLGFYTFPTDTNCVLWPFTSFEQDANCSLCYYLLGWILDWLGNFGIDVTHSELAQEMRG